MWSTHAHWDHVLDGHGLRALPRWRAGADAPADASWRERRTRERDDDEVLAAHLAAHPGDAAAPVVGVPPVACPRDGDHLAWSGPDVVVVEHAAHAPDHGALVVVDAHVLVCGDMLSDREVPLLDGSAADPVGDYRSALDALEEAAERWRVSVVVPGHGSPGDRDDLLRRLAADRAYLDDLVTGRSADPRLADSWVAAAHAARVAALGR